MKCKSFLISILVSFIIISSAFGYGAATHTYFANELGYQYGILNLHEMYGSVVPDMFNLLFGHPDQDFLWNLTHYKYRKVIKAADSDLMDAFAYGFKSHNEKNGADLTAHLDSFTYPGYGYVNIKREEVADEIQDEVDYFLESIGEYDVDLAEELALRIADTAVESAIDYLVSRKQDPYVGTQMAIASIARSPMVPLLLCKAYIWDLTGLGMSFGDSISLIYGAEAQFREYMLLYGLILSSPDALDLLAEQGASLAEQILLQEYQVMVTVPPELMKDCLEAAICVVQNDYSKELAKTLRYLKRNM